MPEIRHIQSSTAKFSTNIMCFLVYMYKYLRKYWQCKQGTNKQIRYGSKNYSLPETETLDRQIGSRVAKYWRNDQRKYLFYPKKWDESEPVFPQITH
jgi:hypothetical protein